jgi:hypothetical protein
MNYVPVGHLLNLNSPRRVGLVLMCWAVLGQSGCDRESEQVRSYTVPKEAPPPAPVETPPRPPQSNARPAVMQWDLPAGWQQEPNPNPNAIRFATLSVGSDQQQFEVSVTRLGGDGGGAMANIARWRNQLGLEPAPAEELNALTEHIHTRTGGEGVLVDLLGPTPEGQDAQPMRMLGAIFPAGGFTWFLKATAPQAVVETHRAAFVELCRSVRFAAPPTPAPRPGPPRPTWSAVPDGWKPDAQPRPMSVASLTISNAAQEASFTITPLPGPPNLLANINRWRQQIGLDPVQNLDKLAPQTMQIAGAAGSYVDLVGSNQHILGVIASRDGQTWFFKLTGPDPLVAEQKPAFETFVRSIRFDGGPG